VASKSDASNHWTPLGINTEEVRDVPADAKKAGTEWNRQR
jgi:hypothetical protein